MPRHAIRLALETLLALAALAGIPRLSRSGVLRAARFLGRVAYRVSPSLRRVGLANLRLAYPDATPAEHDRVLRASFHNFALVILDTFWFARETGSRIAQYVHLDRAGYAPTLRPAPQILITAHMGNWEVMGMTFTSLGYPLISVAAPLDNPAVDQLFNQLRKSTGQRIVSKHGALRQLLRTLREGGKIALLLDQNTKPKDGGLFVPFFGIDVPVSSAAAALWQRTGAEVYVFASIPLPDGHYRLPGPIQVPAPEGGECADPVLEMTRRITASTEAWIRQHPEHWLWMYKRWKYVPPGGVRAAYPFYAKQLNPA